MFLEDEIRLLGQVGFPQEKCINYLTPDEAHEEIRATWQNREYIKKIYIYIYSFIFFSLILNNSMIINQGFLQILFEFLQALTNIDTNSLFVR